MYEPWGGTINFHWAINSVRRQGGPLHTRMPPKHLWGKTFDTGYAGIQVKVVEPTQLYVCASSCRMERDDYHNRVHVARTRWIATSPTPIKGRRVMEYGIAACGQALTDPLYLDEPTRLCDCGNGDASPCPRCYAVLDVRNKGLTMPEPRV